MVRSGQYTGVTGVGFLAWGNEVDVLRSVELSDSLIENYDAAGVVADAALANGTSRTSGAFGLFALLEGNRVSGAGGGAGVAGQDGYRLLNRATTVAIENHFTDNSDAGIDVQNSISSSQTRFNRNNIQRNRIGFRHEAAFAVCTQDPGRTNKYRLDAIENWWGSPMGPSTDDVAGRGDVASGNLAAPIGCTATAGTPDTTDRVDFRRFLGRPAPISAQLSEFRDAQPTVEITAPAAGADLDDGEPLAITATAGDDIGVHSVKFYRGDTLLGEDKVAPYTASWTPAGDDAWTTQSITAIATDSAGQTGADAVAVGGEDDAAPFVELLRPTQRAQRLAALRDRRRRPRARPGHVLPRGRARLRRPRAAVHLPCPPRLRPERPPERGRDRDGLRGSDGDRHRLPADAGQAQAEPPDACKVDKQGNRAGLRLRRAQARRSGVENRDGCEGKVRVQLRQGGEVDRLGAGRAGPALRVRRPPPRRARRAVPGHGQVPRQ